MARRGEKLREHILFTAKDLFLERGFERVSMDAVAARAQTSKRTLYAHFDSKERLFTDVIEFVRRLVLDRLGLPGEYADDPQEALVRFCARYLRVLLYRGSIQMCRVTMAEAARFPEGAARFHDLICAEIAARIADHLRLVFNATDGAASELADRLLGRLLYPRFPRILFGVEPPITHLDEDGPACDIDDGAVRSAVAEMLASVR